MFSSVTFEFRRYTYQPEGSGSDRRRKTVKIASPFTLIIFNFCSSCLFPIFLRSISSLYSCKMVLFTGRLPVFLNKMVVVEGWHKHACAVQRISRPPQRHHNEGPVDSLIPAHNGSITTSNCQSKQ